MIAGLARFCGGDISRAEELAQDAIVVALETWPIERVPRNPGAWLITTAKNRQIDLARRTQIFRRKREEIGRELQSSGAYVEQPSEAGEAAIDDDVLRLVFTTCHPSLSRDSQVALTLRMLGGLSTDEIARALLTTESTVGQRISRAKRTLADAGSPFEVPGEDELADRLAAVLGVIYLIFNEGYAATSGDDWMRLDLCEDALRLGRLMQAQLPGEPEVHGLAALMEIQASRSRARRGEGGKPVLLLDQDRSLWDRTLIRRGLTALERARSTPGRKGTYTLQAEIAACHARAARADETDWRLIADLYRALAALTGSPIVEVNRAVAVGMADGPEAGLDVLEQVAQAPELAHYHLFFSVRADLLEKAGRRTEAISDLSKAASMTDNLRERELLEARIAVLSSDG